MSARDTISRPQALSTLILFFCLYGMASYVGYTEAGNDQYAAEINGLGEFSANLLSTITSAATGIPSCCYALPNAQITSAGPSKRFNPAFVKNCGFRLLKTAKGINLY